MYGMGLKYAWNVPGMTWNTPGIHLEWGLKKHLFFTWIPLGMTWNDLE